VCVCRGGVRVRIFVFVKHMGVWEKCVVEMCASVCEKCEKCVGW
jgi:hypothetical protein